MHGAKGCLDHRLRATPVYTAQYRKANQNLANFKGYQKHLDSTEQSPIQASNWAWERGPQGVQYPNPMEKLVPRHAYWLILMHYVRFL